jgi:hypothetical protein
VIKKVSKNFVIKDHRRFSLQLLAMGQQTALWETDSGYFHQRETSLLLLHRQASAEMRTP